MKTSGGTYLRTLQQIQKIQKDIDSGAIGGGSGSLTPEQIQQLQQLSSQVTSNTNNITVLGQQQSTINADILSLQNQQSTQDSSLQSVIQDVSTIQTQQSIQDSLIQTNINNINNLTSTVNGHTSSINTINLQQTTQDGKILINTNSIQSIQNDIGFINGDIQTLQSQQTSQDGLIQTNANNITNLTSTVNGHTSSINTINSYQNTQDSLIQTNANNISTIQSQQTTQDGKITNLDNQMSGQVTSVLGTRITQVESQINSLIAGTTSYASLHVNQTSGNDSTGDGSLTKPFASFQKCLESFTPGSPKTIYIHSPHSTSITFRVNDKSLMVIMDPKITVSSNITYVSSNESIYWVGQSSQMTGIINDESSAGMIAYDTIFTGTYNKNATISSTSPQGYVEFTSRSNVDGMILNLTCNTMIRLLGTGSMGAITQTNGFLVLQHSGSIVGIGKPALTISSPNYAIGQVPITLIQGQIQLITDQTKAIISTAVYGFIYLTQLSTVQTDLTTYKQIDCGSSNNYIVKIWANIDCSKDLITAPATKQLITHGTYLKADYTPSNYTTITDNVPAHLSGIDSKIGYILGQTSQIPDIISSLNSLDTTIQGHTSTLTTHAGQISTNTSNITNLSNTVGTFQTAIDNNEQAIIEVQQNLNSLNLTGGSSSLTLQTAPKFSIQQTTQDPVIELQKNTNVGSITLQDNFIQVNKDLYVPDIKNSTFPSGYNSKLTQNSDDITTLQSSTGTNTTDITDLKNKTKYQTVDDDQTLMGPCIHSTLYMQDTASIAFNKYNPDISSVISLTEAGTLSTNHLYCTDLKTSYYPDGLNNVIYALNGFKGSYTNADLVGLMDTQTTLNSYGLSIDTGNLQTTLNGLNIKPSTANQQSNLIMNYNSNKCNLTYGSSNVLNCDRSISASNFTTATGGFNALFTNFTACNLVGVLGTMTTVNVPTFRITAATGDPTMILNRNGATATIYYNGTNVCSDKNIYAGNFITISANLNNLQQYWTDANMSGILGTSTTCTNPRFIISNQAGGNPSMQFKKGVSSFTNFTYDGTNLQLDSTINPVDVKTTSINSLNTWYSSIVNCALSGTASTTTFIGNPELQILSGTNTTTLTFNKNTYKAAFTWNGTYLNLDKTLYVPDLNFNGSVLTTFKSDFDTLQNSYTNLNLSGSGTTTTCTNQFFTISSSQNPTIQLTKSGITGSIYFDGTTIQCNKTVYGSDFQTGSISSLNSSISTLTTWQTNRAWVGNQITFSSPDCINTNGAFTGKYINAITDYKWNNNRGLLPIISGSASSNLITEFGNMTSARSNGTGNVGYGYVFSNNVMASGCDSNTAVGNGVLSSVTTAQYNCAFGANNSSSLSTAKYNVCVGNFAGYALTVANTCDGNTFVGYRAGITQVSKYMTCLGYTAGDGFSGNNYGTYIGYGAHSSGDNVVSEMVLTASQTALWGKGSNTTYISGSSGCYNQANSLNFATTSDINQKNIDGPISIGLKQINQLNLVNFHYKTKEQLALGDSKYYTEDLDPNWQYCGVIAQELQQIQGFQNCVIDNGKGLSVDWSDINIANVRAVQELSKKVDDLQNVINDLKDNLAGRMFVHAGVYNGTQIVCKCKGQLFEQTLYPKLYEQLQSNVLPNIPDIYPGCSYYIVMK